MIIIAMFSTFFLYKSLAAKPYAFRRVDTQHLLRPLWSVVVHYNWFIYDVISFQQDKNTLIISSLLIERAWQCQEDCHDSRKDIIRYS